jgi:hypothetical protein
MLSSFQNHFEHKSAGNRRPRIRVELPRSSATPIHGSPKRRHTFSKIFRWRLPEGQTQPPASVEIVGSFTGWTKAPLTREQERDVWTITFPDIPVNRTHHYMLLVDGKPVSDENADGLAIPRGPQEEQYQLMTKRGGRVFMLYSQAK